MAKLSEAKGVDNWLATRGIHPQRFRQIIIKKSGIPFYKTYFKPTKESISKFHKFANWFLNQDTQSLRQEYNLEVKLRDEKRKAKNQRAKENLLKEMEEINFDGLVEQYRGKSKRSFQQRLKELGVGYKRLKLMIEQWKLKN